ncbi:hypothetical protein [Parageobacillus toebii]|uniref:Uncharacterized protein n=1 Tax=Parageobacillus toebii TaxID=153151 RepID=A0A150MV70_9BACL|nr:hypothetical protein [Parageobacillus toebii]KYD28378.1 hypothetical protein B4110_3729 [Parageobacillus toebii]
MAQYHIPINDEFLHGLLPKDQGLTKLLEQILNQILEEGFRLSDYWQWQKTKKQEARSVNEETPAMKREG